MSSHESFIPSHRSFQFALCACAALLLVFPLAAAPKKKLPSHPIDLNTATLAQLEELPGVGPVTAQKILDFRAKSGPFKSIDDLLAVPRISKNRFAKIKPYVYVKPPAAKPKP
ncbi:MAG: helix-hairpin-helix domain-containing protein [Candidatus Acidiferrales bacterium]